MKQNMVYEIPAISKGISQTRTAMQFVQEIGMISKYHVFSSLACEKDFKKSFVGTTGWLYYLQWNP